MNLRSLAVLVLVMLGSIQHLSGQDISAEILNYQDSSKLIIKNSRMLILKVLRDWNLQKASQIKQYLDEEIVNDQYHAFSLGEEMLLSIAIGDYRKPLLIATYWDSLRSNYYGYPLEDDNFYGNLVKVSIDHQEKILQNIKDIILADDQKDFISLLYTTLIAIDPDQNIDQDSLNQRAKRFLNKYELSPYRKFISSNILHEVEPSRVAYGIHVGVGFPSVTGEAGNVFDIKTPFMVGFDIPFDRAYLSLKILGGAGEIARSFTHDGQDYNVRQFKVNPLLVLVDGGFSVINRDKFRIAPFGSLGGYSITPVESEDADLDLSSFTIGMGVNMDVAFSKKVTRNLYGVSSQNEFGLRATYGSYGYRFADASPLMEGRYNVFSIAFYWLFRSMNVK